MPRRFIYSVKRFHGTLCRRGNGLRDLGCWRSSKTLDYVKHNNDAHRNNYYLLFVRPFGPPILHRPSLISSLDAICVPNFWQTIPAAVLAKSNPSSMGIFSSWETTKAATAVSPAPQVSATLISFLGFRTIAFLLPM